MTLQEIKKKGNAKLSEILTAKQQIAWKYLTDSETVETLYGGAAGGGKSLLGALWLAVNCLKYPGSRWVMGRSKLKTLKETTLATFFEITSALNWSGLYEYKEQKGLIKWNNGSEILLRDLFAYPSDPEFDSLGSLEVTGAFVDECSQITHKAKSILRSRIRFKLTEFDLIPKMLLTCNPSKNYVYSEFYKPWKEKKLPKDRAFIPALVSDNPYLPESYIASLRRLPEASRQRLLYGNFDYDDDPDALISYDAQRDLFTNSFVKDQTTLLPAITADVALQGSDKMVVGVWMGFVLVAYYIYGKTDGKEVVDKLVEISRRHHVPASRIVYDADGVGGFLRGFLPGAKPFVNNASPMKVNGKPENYRNLKSQCYYRMAERVDNRGMWIEAEMDHDEMEMVKEELGQVKRWKSDKDGKMEIMPKSEIKANIGRSPDFADMLMMREYLELAPKRRKSITID